MYAMVCSENVCPQTIT
jgi:hypothetical protein